MILDKYTKIRNIHVLHVILYCVFLIMTKLIFKQKFIKILTKMKEMVITIYCLGESLVEYTLTGCVHLVISQIKQNISGNLTNSQDSSHLQDI